MRSFDENRDPDKRFAGSILDRSPYRDFVAFLLSNHVKRDRQQQRRKYEQQKKSQSLLHTHYSLVVFDYINLLLRQPEQMFRKIVADQIYVI